MNCIEKGWTFKLAVQILDIGGGKGVERSGCGKASEENTFHASPVDSQIEC